MTLSFDLFWSFRSPYSYLATGRIMELERDYDLTVRVRPVYPLAVRVKDYFKTIDPRWVHYVIMDVARVADHLGIPFAPPSPDPIVMNMKTGDVPEEQPYIHRLMRLGIVAGEQGRGLAFVDSVSRMVWSGQVQNWDQGTTFRDWIAKDGFDLEALEARVAQDPDRLDAVVVENEEAQAASGHWGVPLMVFEGEPFFGQDRLDLLLWRMKSRGLKERA